MFNDGDDKCWMKKIHMVSVILILEPEVETGFQDAREFQNFTDFQ